MSGFNNLEKNNFKPLFNLFLERNISGSGYMKPKAIQIPNVKIAAGR
jgi:hypothetical protein